MPSISEECLHYCDACDLASKDDEFFSSFKRNRFYRAVLEHVDNDQGLMYYNEIDDNSQIKKNLKKASINDTNGSPLTCEYEFGTFSPTTLRYAKVLNDITKMSEIDGKRIVEIGAGYGGQYVVTRQFFKPHSYTFFDVEPATRLIRKYIDVIGCNDIELNFRVSNESVPLDNYDLVISNYAISECDSPTQDYYFDNVISRSAKGYVTHNHMRGYSLDEFVARLQSLGKSPQIHEERPQTSPPSSKKNFIITW